MSTAKAEAALVAAQLASKTVASKLSVNATTKPTPTPATTETDSSKTEKKPKLPRIFNKIILTLENSLLPEEKLANTPSFLDGLDAESEKDLRILGCEQIQTAGILLRLPQVAMATGQVLFQRFFYAKSFVRHNMSTVAMSCVYLASKIEEEPRRIRDVMNVFHHMKQVRLQKDITPMLIDQPSYINLKTEIIKDERRVLKELGFCVHVKHPHKIIVMYLQVLKYERHERLMQMSWNFMNDSLRTDVFMRYTPETIACACIYLSARKLGIPLPRTPPWFVLFHANEDDIIDICYRVMDLYVRNKPNIEQLESAVEELKKRYIESRNKNKEHNTSPAVTMVDRNNPSHNAWGGFIQRTVPLPLPKEEKSPVRESRSRSPRSRTRSRSPISKGKKKARQYSRSPSSSPHNKHHHKRKSSRHRERSFDKYEKYETESSSKRFYNAPSNVDKYERFEKYEKPDKYEKYDKYDKYRNYRQSDKYRGSSTHKPHRHQNERRDMRIDNRSRR